LYFLLKCNSGCKPQSGPQNRFEALRCYWPLSHTATLWLAA